MKSNTADKEALFEKVLRSFRAYYNIDRETPAEPFDAEASFDMRDEQYFLTKSARISQSDSHEYVFFRLLDHLDPETFHDLDRKAWETTLSRVDLSRLPCDHCGHRGPGGRKAGAKDRSLQKLQPGP